MAPPWQLIGHDGRWQVRHINPVSDGDAREWPGKPQYRPSSEERYLINLGKRWMEEDGLSQPGVNYYINKLPDGYALFEQDQQSGSSVYKRLFGHPSGRFFDSSKRFEVHFLWLMSGMQGDCTCFVCTQGKGKSTIQRKRMVPEQSLVLSERIRTPAISISEASSRSNSTTGRILAGTSSRPQRQIKAAGTPYAVDENGNEDVYKELIKRLFNAKDSKKGIEDDIIEPNNMDWRATHTYGGYGSKVNDRHLASMEVQHSFIPRVGELVLWIPSFLDEHYLMIDEKSEYKFYSFDQECFHGHPAWRAGVIAEVPAAKIMNGPIDFPDIQCLTEKKTALNTAGFRVETFPDPNNEVDKSASKQYRYVPMRNIRPFTHWHALLRGVPQEKWHDSIKHALTCMTSMSLWEKYWFSGQWPNAHIQCKGLYLGPELIIVGDAVRIRPNQPPSRTTPKCTDIMVVDQIRLNLVDIKAEYTLGDSQHLASSYTVTLKGRGYTLDVRRSYQMQAQGLDSFRTSIPSSVPLHEVKTAIRAVGAADYGAWYYLHDPTKRYEISHDMVLGRLYEAGAVQLWTGQLQTQGALVAKLSPSLNFDLHAIVEGRRYATQNDLRLDDIPEGEIRWYFGDHRADALDIEIFNGNKIGRFAKVRDKHTQEQWRHHLKVLNGQSLTADPFKYTSFSQYTIPGSRGRKPGSKVVNGKVVRPGEPGYDEIFAVHEPEAQSMPKEKHNSLLIRAAFVSTDEDDDEEQEQEQDEEAAERFYSADEGDHGDDLKMQEPESKGKQKEPMTKAQIMTSVEQMDFEADDDFSDDNWYDEPVPLARGGTEESDGGDYRPTQVDIEDD